MNGRRAAAEFPADLAWVNTCEPPCLADSRGRVALIHFWSYDSVHCINQLPMLRQLENKYHDGLSVFGVHVPKYPAQRDGAAVLKAVNRHHVRHPVANDADWALWQALGIDAWPTLLLFDCEGALAGRYVGEGWQAEIDAAIGALLDDAAARDLRQFDPAPVAFRPEPRMPLRFPSHVLATPDRLYVSDSAQNRILECTHDGRILRQFGSGNPGHWDGRLAESGFRHPQSMVRVDDVLYVADTGNHCVRRIRLDSGATDTVLGNGSVGRQRPQVGCRPDAIGISAPSGLAAAGERLYVALAGQHQVWRLDPVRDRVDLLAGSGLAGGGDGPAFDASFAQPSALALLPGRLLVADAAGNAIRQVRLADGMVGTVAGGGAYRWGCSDGRGEAARLAHPLGIASDAQGNVYVADTLNDRVCLLDVATGMLATLQLDYRFREPHGLSAAAGALWVADRNAHSVVRVDIASGACRRIGIGE
ncbi:alkyl hydroperoxide reductase [Mizugakiibacter sediminis]|uniref:Alkyl hydroperoxide reductase n=1 Tax=Mizugakiibacter sediminis TaxID=1475481 RepID=A0A0K8QIG4_9GAMM|nr:thioredoxin-like domain-containing protein [Mizugakiibacter sediminis]GAP64725.1 alkyl hydroperoxide reductase [Mizugakiibacter sediminis]